MHDRELGSLFDDPKDNERPTRTSSVRREVADIDELIEVANAAIVAAAKPEKKVQAKLS